MTSQERFNIIKDILEKNDLGVSTLYIRQFNKLSELELLTESKTNAIIDEIKTYEKHTSGNKNIYPDNIMRNVRQNLGLDELDISRDNEIMSMAKQDVFNRYCEWNGLLGGYGYDLLNVVEDIYSINLQQ